MYTRASVLHQERDVPRLRHDSHDVVVSAVAPHEILVYAAPSQGDSERRVCGSELHTIRPVEVLVSVRVAYLEPRYHEVGVNSTARAGPLARRVTVGESGMALREQAVDGLLLLGLGLWSGGTRAEKDERVGRGTA